MPDPTPNLGLERPDFNVVTWHDQINGNFTILDSLVYNAIATDIRFALFASGKPGAGELLTRYVFTDAIRFPSSLSTSRGSSIIASAASSAFAFARNGVNFGTATFGIGASIPIFAGSETLFNIGDILTITAPLVQDTTLSSVSLTLAATKEP